MFQKIVMLVLVIKIWVKNFKLKNQDFGPSTVNNDVQCSDGCYDIIGEILVASGEIKTIDTDGKVKIDMLL